MARLEVARLNDTSDHGGRIISASPNVNANGKAVARNGDSHSCPITGHGVTALTATSTVSLANAKFIIRVGDTAGCGAMINSGSTTVFAG